MVMGTWARGEEVGPPSFRASLPPRVRVEVSRPVQAWLSEKLPPQMPCLARVGRALGEGGSVLARPPSITGTSGMVYTAGVRQESKGSWDETSCWGRSTLRLEAIEKLELQAARRAVRGQ